MFRNSLQLIATVSLSASLTALTACGELSGSMAEATADPAAEDTGSAASPAVAGSGGTSTAEEALPTEVAAVLNLHFETAAHTEAANRRRREREHDGLLHAGKFHA